MDNLEYVKTRGTNGIYVLRLFLWFGEGLGVSISIRLPVICIANFMQGFVLGLNPGNS